jgi:hypothetical protein
MKTNMRSFMVLLVLLASLFTPLFAEGSEYSQALGVQVGRLAGVGISYQKWLDDFGYQVAGGLLYHPEMVYGNDQLVYNIGFELQYPLVYHEVNSSLAGTLYFVGGVHHQGYREAKLTSADPDVYSAGPLILNLGIGGGIGVETILFKHFAISTEFVYMGMYELNTSTLNVDMYPQVSLRYRF